MSTYYRSIGNFTIANSFIDEAKIFLDRHQTQIIKMEGGTIQYFYGYNAALQAICYTRLAEVQKSVDLAEDLYHKAFDAGKVALEHYDKGRNY